ncbi:hypothetical protein FQN60_017745 [Etheostoma spectabile]|uniref:Uncharacterized protein n=1 Tax=Etheostoma spectabile TaxID=54343 RepID=A0A5J5DGG6_9PERO|nr:hypothetical protein FQN60_017745 [Etheostoma spectabile]
MGLGLRDSQREGGGGGGVVRSLGWAAWLGAPRRDPLQQQTEQTGRGSCSLSVAEPANAAQRPVSQLSADSRSDSCPDSGADRLIDSLSMPWKAISDGYKEESPSDDKSQTSKPSREHCLSILPAWHHIRKTLIPEVHHSCVGHKRDGSQGSESRHPGQYPAEDKETPGKVASRANPPVAIDTDMSTLEICKSMGSPMMDS